jgi:outer membrane protein OmpA-like peptidoglycan-associated protein
MLRAIRMGMHKIRLPKLHSFGAAILALTFICSDGVAFGQGTSTTPDIQKKETELKQKEVELKQKEIDFQKKQIELDKLKQDLKYQETAKSISISLQGDVLFDFGKAELRPEAEAGLEKVGTVIQQFPEGKVHIDGFTDSKGGKKQNMALSRERAVAVKQWLVKKKGIAAASISAKGLGEENPVAANENADGSDNPDGRAQNRRVQITVEK